MSTQSVIPNDVIVVVADVLGGYYYSHTQLNVLFSEAGAPDDPPDGNCVNKCIAWLKRCNTDESIDALEILGSVLSEFMVRSEDVEGLAPGRERIERVLGRNGLSYGTGGIVGGHARAPVSSLQKVLRTRDIPSLEREITRALAAVEKDPPAGLTAACALVESTCTVIIEDAGLPLPKKQTIKELWKVVADHLGFDPASKEDQDIRKVLSGLVSVVDGVGALRTHAGSAHGRGRSLYKIEPRHARLAIHAAHTLCTFLLETQDRIDPKS